MRYEYIRIAFDWGDLQPMNQLSMTGWRVVHVGESGEPYLPLMALLERELPGWMQRS